MTRTRPVDVGHSDIRLPIGIECKFGHLTPPVSGEPKWADEKRDVIVRPGIFDRERDPHFGIEAFRPARAHFEDDLIIPCLQASASRQQDWNAAIRIRQCRSQFLALSKETNLNARGGSSNTRIQNMRGNPAHRTINLFSRKWAIFICSWAAICNSFSALFFRRASSEPSISAADFPVAQMRKITPNRSRYSRLS